jgi:uncharacterized membrane protein YdbT with pleckstrin-like domain
MGSYVEKNLLNSESITYRAYLSRIIYLRAALLLIVGVVLALYSQTFSAPSVLLFIAAAVGFIAAFIKRATSEFAVTNKRIILKVGLIRRRSMEIMLNKVESIDVSQGIIGRVLNFGSIAVVGTGGTKDPFHRISKPLGFRRAVQEQLANS